MFSVVVETGKSGPRTIRCLHKECGIGRSDENLVILQGWSIARHHATIRVIDEAIYIESSGSRAAVRVNGSAIKSQHGPLEAADVVEIGDYTLRISSELGKARRGAAEQKHREAAAPAAANDSVAGEAPAPAPRPVAAPPAPASTSTSTDLATTDDVPPDIVVWRERVHASLLKQMDLRRIDVHSLSDEELRVKTSELIDAVLDKEYKDLPKVINRKMLAKQVLDEAIGLGPLENLIEDNSVTEIMVNAHDQIYIERAGRIEKSPVYFTNDRAVLSAIERIVTPLGRRIDESSPMVDARLKDGSRVNAIIPPIALRGPSISIRKFAKRKLEGRDLIAFGSLDDSMLAFLEIAVRERKNIVVTGGTGSGKTTLLNILSNFIPDRDRIVTIEDAAELKLVQPNLVALEARPPNLEGKGQVTIRDLVKNALRMRPDRIVVGECRGGETLDMLQAMNTGHEGSLTTAHANSPRDAISRVEVMVLMAGMDLPMAVVREQIASAVDLIVHQRRYPCGSRKVSHITEVTGIESGTIQLQDIFNFKVTTFTGHDGKVEGRFVATGSIPEFMEELADRGVPIDLDIFRKPEE
ncbi:ATPase, T2SS/T4P/T4SS family [Marilutibacter chinensis]|uniref:Flp pilus assembly complex ATPase component TadA n=1 Tax=Marilutibacter chinensis TaxID=2912247 RepID=A0ABS9HZV3_9GAMM|nr:ATPase, T2SS/T4P/T4SS family [Lysobacter chinensis]MCF7223597.1 Flp pilus assembly complex ATPase component TadA [Lysobacter chinensis]